MTFESSEQALPTLEDQVGPPTSEQVKIAKIAGVSLSSNVPRLVAAARLRDSLSDSLDTAPPSGPSEYQSEYLENLALQASIEVPAKLTRAEASAWILHCQLLMRIQAHTELMLDKGDIVRRLGPNSNDIGEVSSISKVGCVWLRGRGNRLWPDQLEVVARASQEDDVAENARRVAANLREASKIVMLNEAQERELAPYCPSEPFAREDLEGLRDIIDNASNEQPIQAFLNDHPQLLASLLQGPHHFVRSQVRLGSHYVTDFMIADANSTGLHWIYVELETPGSPVLLQDGKALESKARAGVNQIRNWREWIADNLAYARNLQSKNGTGLPGIRANDEGLVLVGRRYLLNHDHANVRQRLYEESKIAIRTYDWLLEVLEASLSSTGISPGATHLLDLNLAADRI